MCFSFHFSSFFSHLNFSCFFFYTFLQKICVIPVEMFIHLGTEGSPVLHRCFIQFNLINYSGESSLKISRDCVSLVRSTLNHGKPVVLGSDGICLVRSLSFLKMSLQITLYSFLVFRIYIYYIKFQLTYFWCFAQCVFYLYFKYFWNFFSINKTYILRNFINWIFISLIFNPILFFQINE